MRSSMSRFLGTSPFFFGLLTMGFATAAHAATDEERAGARALASAGLESCNAERWQDCAEKFERAESIVHSPVHLLYIGRARLKLNQLVEAREAFLKISREGAPAGSSETVQNTVTEAQQQLEQLEPRVPLVNVHVNGADKDIKLFMDGREISAALIGVARPVNPGPHEFKATAPGMTSTPVKVSVAEGEKKEATVELVVDPNAPKEAPLAADGTATADSGSGAGFKMNGLTVGGIAAAAVGVGGAVVGTIFLLDSKSQHDKVVDLCGGDTANCQASPNTDAAKQIEAANNKAGDDQLIGIIGVGVGAVGLVAGGVLIYMGQTQEEAPAKSGELHVKPYFGFQSVGLTGSW